MALNKWRFIHSGVVAEHPTIHRAVIEHDGLRIRVVAMLEPSAAVRVAAELVEGYATVCGAWWRLRDGDGGAGGGRVPVGAVNYTAWSP
jgi:hypothetical protein